MSHRWNDAWIVKLMKCYINEMSHQLNVTIIKWHFNEMLDRKTTCWWNVTLIQWDTDEMSHWWNVTPINCHIDKMACQWNDMLINWLIDKMTHWQKDSLTKGLIDKMTHWQNDMLAKWQSVILKNVTLMKCHINKMSRHQRFIIQAWGHWSNS